MGGGGEGNQLPSPGCGMTGRGGGGEGQSHKFANFISKDLAPRAFCFRLPNEKKAHLFGVSREYLAWVGVKT